LLSYPQQRGFFQTGNWLRFEVENSSSTSDWILEFAFPLINQLDIYVKTSDGLELLYQTGSDFPFDQRPIDHRFFAFPLEIDHTEKVSYYAYAVGSGDLHPSIILWDR